MRTLGEPPGGRIRCLVAHTAEGDLIQQPVSQPLLHVQPASHRGLRVILQACTERLAAAGCKLPQARHELRHQRSPRILLPLPEPRPEAGEVQVDPVDVVALQHLANLRQAVRVSFRLGVVQLP